MNRDALLRRMERLEARLPEPSGCRDELAALSDLELWELAAAVFEAEGILDNPLCIEEEIGCECLREPRDLVGDAVSLDLNRAARLLHQDGEVNLACLFMQPGCACRDLAAAALEDPKPSGIRYEAGLLHKASSQRAVEGGSPVTAENLEESAPPEEPPEPSEVKEKAPVAKRRSSDPPEPDPNRGRAWEITMVKAPPEQAPGQALDGFL